MTQRLRELIESSRDVQLTEEQIARMVRSFAFGNLRIEDELVTREMIDQVADEFATAQTAV
jgi:hypothetical protein